MSCCRQCEGLENLFDGEIATEDLDDYRKHGPSHETRIMLDVLRRHDLSGLTLLDIGGGVGVIQHELFAAGIASAVDVDASTAYLRTARQEAERRGTAERTQFHHGDFVALAGQIAPADIVTLDRVICCYPDMPAMVRLSAERARRFYAFVFPRDLFYLRWAQRVADVFLWLTRNKYRFYIHPTREVDSLLQAGGLKPHFHQNTGLFWQVRVYVRPQDADYGDHGYAD
jgi:magnesium-protoporphyrin O-methyltransferase